MLLLEIYICNIDSFVLFHRFIRGLSVELNKIGVSNTGERGRCKIQNNKI